jgi:hypothetical protein
VLVMSITFQVVERHVSRVDLSLGQKPHQKWLGLCSIGFARRKRRGERHTKMPARQTPWEDLARQAESHRIYGENLP